MSVFFSDAEETLQGVDQIENGRRCARSVDVNQVLRRSLLSLVREHFISTSHK